MAWLNMFFLVQAKNNMVKKKKNVLKKYNSYISWNDVYIYIYIDM